MMNLVGLFLLLTLFIFSMAADLQYIYLSTCFICFSHSIALLALLDRQKKRTHTEEKMYFQKILA